MKKLLFVILCCFCLCGCGGKKDWENKLQISQLKYSNDYITGRMKNLTEDAYDVTIFFKLKSGTLEDNNTCTETIKPNKTIDINCLVLNIDESYTYEIEDIKLTKIEIPKLKEGNIDISTLKYHFNEIYENHNLNFIPFNVNFADNDFPYIDEIEYKNNIVKIEGKISQNSNYVSYTEEYNTDTNELNYVSFGESSTNDSNFTNTLLTNISLMNGICNDSSCSLNVNKALLHNDIEEGYCIKVDKWCISTIKDELMNFYFFSKRDT